MWYSQSQGGGVFARSEGVGEVKRTQAIIYKNKSMEGRGIKGKQRTGSGEYGPPAWEV